MTRCTLCGMPVSSPVTCVDATGRTRRWHSACREWGMRWLAGDSSVLHVYRWKNRRGL